VPALIGGEDNSLSQDNPAYRMRFAAGYPRSGGPRAEPKKRKRSLCAVRDYNGDDLHCSQSRLRGTGVCRLRLGRTLAANRARRFFDPQDLVTQVELLEGGLLFGFVLYDQKGRPCVSFGYANDVEAFAGRDLVLAALKGAEQVLGRTEEST
jgi:hypothetical protein